MANYAVMAHFYDEFTEDVPYRAWADFIQSVFQKYGAQPEIVLDLACGTGSLTKLLAEAGYDMIGTDMSPEMLAEASEKTALLNPRPLFLCQRMEKLDLYGTVDAVVCALDSVNYLTSQHTLEAAFARVGLFLNDGGLFIFDVNTEAKFRAIDMQAYIRESDRCFCAWQAEYQPAKRLMDYYLDFFVAHGKGMYERSSEHHVERAHTLEELKTALEKADMQLEGIYGELTLAPPEKDAGRIFCVARRSPRTEANRTLEERE